MTAKIPSNRLMRHIPHPAWRLNVPTPMPKTTVIILGIKFCGAAKALLMRIHLLTKFFILFNFRCKGSVFFACVQEKSAVCGKNCTFWFNVLRTFSVRWTFSVATQRLVHCRRHYTRFSAINAVGSWTATLLEVGSWKVILLLRLGR